MNNEEIAKKVASSCYKSKDDSSELFAIQLFIEEVCLPRGMNRYTKDDIERLVLQKLRVNKSD
jgi:hypothetical protein